MKKIALIIHLALISILILGCKTKRALKNQTKTVERIEATSKVKSTEKETLNEASTVKAVQTKEATVKENKSDVQITGKVDAQNPLTYYNIVNGDTLDLFSIRGNADFIFKSSSLNSDKKENTSSVNNSANTKDSDKTISKVVEDVKNTVKEVQTKTVEVVKKDFTIGSYIVFILWGIVIIVIFALVLWIRKSTWWTKIISKFK